MMRGVSFVLLAFLLAFNPAQATHYEANWTSIDSRPLPDWYDEAKLGIFLHWGVFSVPSLSSEWFWHQWKEGKTDEINSYVNKYLPKDFTYQEFAKDFTAAFFNATQWAELFRKAGAKYVVLTSKHHEGFTLWPSRYSFSWNSVDVGPKRDLVGELSIAVRDQNLTFGVYHSLFEWFNPMYTSDKAVLFLKREFVEKKILPEMKELVETYKPAVLWSDGDWESLDIYWGSTKFLAWLYNESPVKDIVVTNDRWGAETACKHGGFYTCQDRYNPGVLQTHKWENAMTLDKSSWGFRRNAKLQDYITIEELIKELVTTVSCGGNLLVNVGPTKDGIIAPIFEERLLQLGAWMDINNEAIYGTKPWRLQNDTVCGEVWYTSKGSAVYAILLEWQDVVTISPVELFTEAGSKVVLLGNNGELKWQLGGDGVQITLPKKSIVKSNWAYVFKITPGSKVYSV